MDDCPQLMIIDQAKSLKRWNGNYNIETQSFDAAVDIQYRDLHAFHHSKHFCQLMTLLNYLDEHLRGDSVVNKRGVYYTLIDQVTMEGVDDLLVEVMGLVGAGSRLQLGIVASSKGMIGGGSIDQFELSEFCDHLPLPSTPEK